MHIDLFTSHDFRLIMYLQVEYLRVFERVRMHEKVSDLFYFSSSFPALDWSNKLAEWAQLPTLTD